MVTHQLAMMLNFRNRKTMPLVCMLLESRMFTILLLEMYLKQKRKTNTFHFVGAHSASGYLKIMLSLIRVIHPVVSYFFLPSPPPRAPDTT